MSTATIRLLFLIAGLYSFLLGMAFLLAGDMIYSYLELATPNHWAYVHLLALMAAVFGLMFFDIASEPENRRNLIPYGVLLKLCFSGIVLGHYYLGEMPVVWTRLAWIDLAFVPLFLLAYGALGKPCAATTSPATQPVATSSTT